MREPASVTVKVSSGTQLSYDGRTHQAPEAIAERWIVRGWAEPLEPASKPTGDVGKRTTSPRSRRTR